MAGTTVDIGTGTTIEFVDSGYTAEIISVTWDGIERALIDTTHLGSTPPDTDEFGGKTYLIGDLEDPGELTLEMHFNPNSMLPGHQVETIRVTAPIVPGDSTSAYIEGQGVMRSFSFTIPTEGLMTANMRVKMVGVMAIHPAT